MPELNISSVFQKLGHPVLIDGNLDELVLCLEDVHGNKDGWLYKVISIQLTPMKHLYICEPF
jgi:hypothetical protein